MLTSELITRNFGNALRENALEILKIFYKSFNHTLRFIKPDIALAKLVLNLHFGI